MKVNPKTQAVLEAFLDLETPETLRPIRKSQLRELRPKLYVALEALVAAVNPPQQMTEEEADKVFDEM